MADDRVQRELLGDLHRLARDIAADAEVMRHIAEDIRGVAARPAPLGVEASAFLAMKLHGWYTALETVLERIARAIEGGLPSGPSSHMDLLRGATLPIADVRPRVIGPEHLPSLADLLGFRHFFRHAYAVTLDESRLLQHAGAIAASDDAVRADLNAFVAVVRAMIAELANG